MSKDKLVCYYLVRDFDGDRKLDIAAVFKSESEYVKECSNDGTYFQFIGDENFYFPNDILIYFEIIKKIDLKDLL